MPDPRWFKTTYDLYRPVITTSTTGEQSQALPGTATLSSQRCRFYPTPGRARSDELGTIVEYDAVLLYPATQSVQPEAAAEAPDHIKIGSRYFIVLIAWAMGGETATKRALLKERRAPA